MTGAGEPDPGGADEGRLLPASRSGAIVLIAGFVILYVATRIVDGFGRYVILGVLLAGSAITVAAFGPTVGVRRGVAWYAASPVVGFVFVAIVLWRLAARGAGKWSRDIWPVRWASAQRAFAVLSAASILMIVPSAQMALDRERATRGKVEVFGPVSGQPASLRPAPLPLSSRGPTGLVSAETAFLRGNEVVVSQADRTVAIDLARGDARPLTLAGRYVAYAAGENWLWAFQGVWGDDHYGEDDTGVAVRLDPATLQPIGGFLLHGGAPRHVVFAHGSLWVAAARAPVVWRINPIENRLVSRTTLPEAMFGTADVAGIGASAEGVLLAMHQGDVHVLDAAGARLVRTHRVKEVEVFAAAGDVAWVFGRLVDGGPTRLRQLDTRTGRLTRGAAVTACSPTPFLATRDRVYLFDCSDTAVITMRAGSDSLDEIPVPEGVFIDTLIEGPDGTVYGAIRGRGGPQVLPLTGDRAGVPFPEWPVDQASAEGMVAIPVPGRVAPGAIVR